MFHKFKMQYEVLVIPPMLWASYDIQVLGQFERIELALNAIDAVKQFDIWALAEARRLREQRFPDTGGDRYRVELSLQEVSPIESVEGSVHRNQHAYIVEYHFLREKFVGELKVMAPIEGERIAEFRDWAYSASDAIDQFLVWASAEINHRLRDGLIGEGSDIEILRVRPALVDMRVNQEDNTYSWWWGHLSREATP